VIDEVIRPILLGQWVAPIQASDDPVGALIETFAANLADPDPRFIECGCPLNNLSQELSNADELFRTHLEGVFDAWRSGLTEAFERGQELGTVRKELPPAAIASFIVAHVEGLATVLKTSRDYSVAKSAADVLLHFVAGLRPTVERPAA
jgi:hypothetical protein